VWVLEEIEERTRRYQGYLWWRAREALWWWQWGALQGRLLDVAASDAPTASRRLAMTSLVTGTPGSLPIDRVAAVCQTWLDDPDPKIRETAAFVLDRLRYELGPQRAAVVASLEAADGGGQRWAEEFIALARQRVPAVAPAEEVTQRPFAALDPDEVVRLLAGATGRDALIVLRDLGSASPRMFLQPYDGEAGPLHVDRIDLDLDGRGGTDALIRIRDAHGIYWCLIPFLHDGARWHFTDTVCTTRDPPQPRVEVTADGRRWLVVRAGGLNHEGSFGAWVDAWLEL